MGTLSFYFSYTIVSRKTKYELVDSCGCLLPCKLTTLTGFVNFNLVNYGTLFIQNLSVIPVKQ